MDKEPVKFDSNTLVNPERLHEVFSPVSTKSKLKTDDLRRHVTISAVTIVTRFKKN